MQLSKDQTETFDFIKKEFKAAPHDENYAVSIDGYGGVGKTFLLAPLIDYFTDKRDTPHLLAPTNKAVVVASKKVQAATDNDFRKGTLHSILYGAPNEDLLWVPNDEKIYRKIVLVDESSMINGEVYSHLMDKYRKSFFIFIGDSFQLEQIGEPSPIYRTLPKKVMTEVLRYDGGILQEANLLRILPKPIIKEHEDIRFALDNQKAVRDFATDLYNGEDAVLLTATNQSRVAYNKAIRAALSKPDRVSNDNLISVSNTGALSNGEVFKASGDGYLFTKKYTIKDIELEVQVYQKGKERFLMVPELPWPTVTAFDFLKTLTIGEAFYLFGDDNYNPTTKKVQNVTVCTWAYSLSTHKSQGSQWDKVYIDFNYCSDAWNPNRWLYTAITRAAKDVTLFNSKYITKARG